MDAQTFAILFMLPIILVIEAEVVREFWGPGRGKPDFSGFRRSMGNLAEHRSGIPLLVMLWLVLTATAWVYEFVIAQVLLYIVLFTFGRVAAALGVVAALAFVVYTPVACGRLVLSLCRRSTTSDATVRG